MCCCCRVLMVDGDHRVGLFAMKDIAEGEELFYNYR
jgi:SET domain-containing protein